MTHSSFDSWAESEGLSPEAITELFKWLTNYAWILSSGLPEWERGDFVQAVAAKGTLALLKYDRKKGTLKGYLAAVAHYVLITELRRRYSARGVGFVSVSDTPEVVDDDADSGYDYLVRLEEIEAFKKLRMDCRGPRDNNETAWMILELRNLDCATWTIVCELTSLSLARARLELHHLTDWLRRELDSGP